MEPRLVAKPWGGRRLAGYGINLPADGLVGEALLTVGTAMVRDGPAAGRTLAEIVAADPLGSIGRRGLDVVGGRPLFPLLIKLIDATANLSIQVHPGAGSTADALGKTEAWYILAAEPGALLYAGLRRDTDVEAFATACARADGEAAAHLRQIRAAPGSTLLIPAGTAHAIGAGVVLYEIQQPFDLTLRLDDWGRRDASGATRELQLKEGLAALTPESRPEAIEAVVLDAPARQCHLLIAFRFFALERIALVEGEQVDLTVEKGITPQVLTSIQGAGAVRAGGREVALRRDAAVVLLAGCGAATLAATEELVALRAWGPELTTDIAVPAGRSGVKEAAAAGQGGART